MKGSVILIVLLVSLLLFILIIGLFALAITATRISKASENRVKCFNYAEGGLDYAKAVVKEYARESGDETFTSLLHDQSILRRYQPDRDLKLTIFVTDNFDDDDPFNDTDCRIILHTLAIYPLSSRVQAKTELTLRTYPNKEENCLESFSFSNWEQI